MMKLKKKISKKMVSTHINFLNLWPELLEQKHPIWNNHGPQPPTNQMLKDEIRKQKFNYTKESKTKK